MKMPNGALIPHLYFRNSDEDVEWSLDSASLLQKLEWRCRMEPWFCIFTSETRMKMSNGALILHLYFRNSDEDVEWSLNSTPLLQKLGLGCRMTSGFHILKLKNKMKLTCTY